MDDKEEQLILKHAELVCAENYKKPFGPKEFENDFIINTLSSRVKHFQKAIYFGLFLLAVYSIAEYLNLGDAADKVLILRLLVMVPCSIAALHYFSKPKFAFWQDWLIVGASFIIFILALIGRYQAYKQGLIYYYYSYLILMCYINIVVQPRFIPALINSCLICFGALLFFYILGTESNRFIFIVYESIFFTVLSLTANYYLQLTIRKNYGRMLLQRRASKSAEEAKEKLLELSNIDSLTQLNNRHYFDTYKSDFDQVNTGVLFIDIDHFKLFNDQYGHILGDESLKKVADVLQANVRKDDLLIRYGGEEFVILIKDSSSKVILDKAKKINEAVKLLNIKHDGSEYGYITVSLGWCFMEEEDTLDACIQKADDSLYKAKSLGRNQFYPPK